MSKKVGKEVTVTVRGAQGLCMSNYHHDQTVWFCGLSNLPRTRISTVRVCQGPGGSTGNAVGGGKSTARHAGHGEGAVRLRGAAASAAYPHSVGSAAMVRPTPARSLAVLVRRQWCQHWTSSV